MENKENGKVRFNFIDAIIILAIIAVIGAIVYMTVLGGGESAGTEKPVAFTLKITGINEKYIETLTEGDTLYNSSTGDEIGKIKSFRTENTKFIGDSVVTDGSGNKSVSVSEYDNLFDVYITVIATASVDERGIAYIGASKLLVGSRFYIRDNAFAATAFCTEFSIE